jgi:hypothetical protein
MSHKITLFLKQSLPFASAPVCAELEPERILCNDVTLPTESHPYNMRLWVLGNEYGAMGAVWASCGQDAIDELIDVGLADGILIDEESQARLTDDDCQELSRGGNAGEPYDNTHLWIAEVAWDTVRDLKTLLKFAEARGAGEDNLDF